MQNQANSLIKQNNILQVQHQKAYKKRYNQNKKYH